VSNGLKGVKLGPEVMNPGPVAVVKWAQCRNLCFKLSRLDAEPCLGPNAGNIGHETVNIGPEAANTDPESVT